MLSKRQNEILTLLEGRPFLYTKEIQAALSLTRVRINKIITPLIKKKLIKREGKARATIYKLAEKRSMQQIIVENWKLRQRVRELENTLEDRKIIERAKEIIMAQFDILPTEAYYKMQQRSMDSGRSMREIAKSILAAYEG